MFCSNCGKTIRPEDDACQHCGASLGEGRFYGNTYTSSQVRLPVEALHEAPEGGMISYTRTNYMSYDNQPQDDVYSNTTYRPLLSDEEDMTRIEAEEAARKAAEEEAAAQAEAETQAEAEQPEAEAESEEAAAPEEEQAAPAEEIYEEEPAEDLPEEAEDIPEISTSPLPPLKKAAISPRVLSYMEEMENREQRRANKSSSGLRLPAFLKKRGKPVEEEELPEEEDIIAAEESYEETGDEAYEPQTEEEYADESEAAADSEDYSEADYSEEDYSEEDYAGMDEAGEEEYDGEDYSDEDYDGADPEDYVADESGDNFEYFEDSEEEDAKPKFSLNIDFKALLQNKILKISVAAVLIVAVVIAGIVWLNFVTAKRPKIVDITNSTYFEGIELLKTSLTEEYRTEMKDTYLVNTSAANTSFSADLQALNALLPAEPKANDPLFVNALTIIQDSIADTIKADADAELKNEDRADASTRDWQAIENAVTLLEEATSVGQLSVIVSDLESVVAPTPSPTPVPTKSEYPTLKNGMMDSVQVQVMQNRLINLGFLSGEPDGDFGNGTEEAVKAFQRAAGLTASGIADHATQEAMFDDNAPRVNPTVSETAAPASPDAAPAG